jgi:hypothetical protein
MTKTGKKPAAPGKSKFRQDSKESKPSDRLRRDPPPGTSGHVDPKSGARGKPLTAEEKEAARVNKAAAKENRHIGKSKLRAEKSGVKLDNARDKLSKQKPAKKPGLRKTVTSAAGSEISAQIHGKIHEYERDNPGLEAAHKLEIYGENTGRFASRHIKKRIRTRPARRVRKMEKKNVKMNADFHFREMAKENPELTHNALKRYQHKKRVQKQFQKQAQEAAKKGAKKAGKEAASLAGKAGKAVVEFVKKNPKVAAILAVCLLLVVIVQSCAGMAMTMFNGLGGGVAGGTSYLAEDADILAAEAAYAGMEADLQYRLDNYAALNQGYDEYRYDLDSIGHDPYVLISILSAFHEGAWTIVDVQPMLTMLFERQYILTETVTVEIRYRTETVTDTWTDDEGVEQSDTYDVEVPYNYYIITVALENFNLSHLPIYIMGETQLSRYALYMTTLGNRPDLFPVHLYPNASTYKSFEIHDIPQEYLDADPVFAAMVAVANAQCGKPYVWGGYSPETSFDCSGFVSYILNSCGWNVGRLGAQGLYNICTPVSASDVRPGDLVFFKYTYAAPDPNGVTHVALYVGDGMVVHAGDPIGYTSINTSYWQSHFFAYGRP